MPGESLLFPRVQAELPAWQSSCHLALLGGPSGQQHPLTGRLANPQPGGLQQGRPG